MGLTEARIADSEEWLLGKFVQDALPQMSTAVVRTDRNDPTRKATLQLRDRDHEVIGYLKYAEGELVRARLDKEQQMLKGLPHGVGPALLKYGPLGNGWGLLIAPVPGKMLRAKSPPNDLVSFLRRLETSPAVSIEVHPWTKAIRDKSTINLDPWFEALMKRDWAVVMQHGDLVPWNMLRKPDDALGAVDWEYGALKGLPFLDLIHYLLQVSALVRRWNPSKTVQYTTGYLTQESWPGLSFEEARALIRLTAYDTYQKALEYEERAPYEPSLQNWRRAVWELPDVSENR